MTQPLRRLDHGGPADPDRVEAVEGTAQDVSFFLEEGKTFLEAVTTPLRARGFKSAAMRITGGVFDPLVYALPALAKEPDRIFRYSDPISPKGGARIEFAQAMFGWRDD